MLRTLAPCLALLSFALPASSQSIVFQNGFESGLSNDWTATGMWHRALDTDACTAAATPFQEGVAAAWYGSDSTCTFDNGFANAGMLTLNNWVTLPTGAGSISLYFRSMVASEYCSGPWSGGWDMHTVVVTAQGGPNGGFTRTLCDAGGPLFAYLPWHERRVDLTAYAGADVKIAFSFWSGDNAENGTLGWLVDDVRIVAEPGVTFCPSPTFGNGCPCLAEFGVGGGCFNSLRRSATLLSGGVASVSNDTLTFQAAEMPPGTTATLFQGSLALPPAIFGDGVLCLSGTLVRLGTQLAPTGSLGWPLASLGPISSSGFVPASGGNEYYQVIYRDALPTHCTSATFNQTSAQRVTWIP